MGEHEQGGSLRVLIVLGVIAIIAFFSFQIVKNHSTKSMGLVREATKLKHELKQASKHELQKESTDKGYLRWKKHYLKSNANNNLYVNSSDNGSYQTGISEAQGYGMYISAKAGADENSYRKQYEYYMQNRGHQSQLMGWYQKYNLSGAQENSDANNATDGDLYIALSLINASEIYPKYHDEYAAQAKSILQDILKYNYNPTDQILTTGNWVTKDSQAYHVFRSSDVNPKMFETFSQFTSDKRWQELSQSMCSKLRKMSEKTTSGLVPDMILVQNNDVSAVRLFSDSDVNYDYNAIRVPLMIRHSNNADAKIVRDRILSFFDKQQDMYATFDLNGHVTGNYRSYLQVKIINVASKNEPQFKNLHERTSAMLAEQPDEYNYFTDTLSVLADVDN